MKAINFVKTLPVKKYREITRWYKISLLLAGLICSSIIVVQVLQLQKLFALKQEKTNLQKQITQFDKFIAKKQKLKKEQEELQLKVAKLDAYRSRIKNTHEYLAYVAHAKLPVHIQELKVEKDIIEIIGQCSQPQEAINFMDVLKKSSYFSNIQLISMHNNKVTQFTIKGNLAKK